MNTNGAKERLHILILEGMLVPARAGMKEESRVPFLGGT